VRFLNKPLYLNFYSKFNSLPNSTILRRTKTLRKEHSNETRAVVITFHKYKLLNGKIAAETGLVKSFVTSIIRQWRKSNYSLINKSKRIGP
jgi:hypothetical protein